MKPDEWYFARSEKRVGPYSLADLKRLAAAKILQPTDMVWQQGAPKWVVASALDGLFSTQGSHSQGAVPATNVPDPVGTRSQGGISVSERDRLIKQGEDRATTKAMIGMGIALGLAFLYHHFTKDRRAKEQEDARKLTQLILEGRTALARQDSDLAIERLTAAIELSPEAAEPYTLRASAFRAKGELDRAIEDCGKAISLFKKGKDPDWVLTDAYWVRGVVFAMKEDYPRAISDFTEAIKHSPEAAILYYNRAKAYLGNGQGEEALQDCARAMQLDKEIAKGDGPELMGEIHLERGKDAHVSKQYDRAISEYTRAIELNPKNARAFFLRNLSYFFKGDHARARLDADEAARLDPKFRIGK
jgi:tetratricopeptide (TPR) repeat protein